MSFLHKISLLEWFLRFSQKTQKVQKIYPIGVTFRKFLPAGSEKKRLALGKAKKWSKNLRYVFLLFRICKEYSGGIWVPNEIFFQNRPPLLKFGFLNLFQNDTRSFSLKEVLTFLLIEKSISHMKMVLIAKI